MNIKDIVNQETNIPFRVRVLPGEKPMIEFYDARFEYTRDDAGVMLGKFVSAYRVETLLGEDGWSKNAFSQDTGLNLYGGVPDYSMDAAGMAEVEKMLLDLGYISELKSTIGLERYSEKEDDRPGF